MGDRQFQDAVDIVSKVIDGAGVVVVVVGLLVATSVYLVSQRSRDQQATAYSLYRQQVGKAILLGLEFLVAADIPRKRAARRDSRAESSQRSGC